MTSYRVRPKVSLSLCCLHKEGGVIQRSYVRVPQKPYVFTTQRDPFDPEDGSEWLVLEKPEEQLGGLVKPDDIVGLPRGSLSYASRVILDLYA